VPTLHQLLDLPAPLLTELVTALQDRRARLLEAYGTLEETIAALRHLRELDVQALAGACGATGPGPAVAARDVTRRVPKPLAPPTGATSPVGFAPAPISAAPPAPTAGVTRTPTPALSRAADHWVRLDAVMAQLAQGPASARQLAAALCLTRPLVINLLAELREQKRVQLQGQTKTARWSLVAPPRRRDRGEGQDVVWSGTKERAGEVRSLSASTGLGSSLAGLPEVRR